MEYVRCSRGLQFDGEGCKGTWQVYEKNKKDFVRAKEEIESYLKNKLEL